MQEEIGEHHVLSLELTISASERMLGTLVGGRGY